MSDKYNHFIKKNIRTSYSIIIENINPSSTILEFGPGIGALTQYLFQKNKCNVYIVEMFEKYYDLAKQYAVDGICCDADSLEWVEYFKDIEFDYIIFADVLEHLQEPEAVLLHATGLLKDTGSVLFSLPNIAHSDVILSLLNNNFPYAEEGLLDKTHIHFFTYKTIVDMFQNVGLKNIEIDYIIRQTGDTELNVPIDTISKDMLSVVANREYGDVYQFVGKASFANENNIVDKAGKYVRESYNAIIYLNDSNIEVAVYYDKISKQQLCNITIHTNETTCFDVILYPYKASIKIADIEFNAGEIKVESVNAAHVDGRDIFSDEARYKITAFVAKNTAQLNIKLRWDKSNISYKELTSIAFVTQDKLNYGLRSKDSEIIARDQEIKELNYGLRSKDSEIIARDEQVKIFMCKANDYLNLSNEYLSKIKELELDNQRLSNELNRIKKSFFAKFIK